MKQYPPALLAASLHGKRLVRFTCRGIGNVAHLPGAAHASPFADKALLPDTFIARLREQVPEAVVATFPYLSDREQGWACRALFERWDKLLADGWQGPPLPPHLLQWVARKRLNGGAG